FSQAGQKSWIIDDPPWSAMTFRAKPGGVYQKTHIVGRRVRGAANRIAPARADVVPLRKRSGMNRAGVYHAAPFLCAAWPRLCRAVPGRTVPMISWLKNQPLRRLLIVAAVAGLVVLTALAWLSVPDNRESLRQLFVGQRHQAQADPTPPPPPANKDNSNSE